MSGGIKSGLAGCGLHPGNLLGRNEPASRVEVTALAGPEEISCQVRDNGVGFDMRHASKLFEVSKRLQRAQECEGSTFCYTLPSERGLFVEDNPDDEALALRALRKQG